MTGSYTELLYMFFFAPENSGEYEPEMDQQLVVDVYNDEMVIN